MRFVEMARVHDAVSEMESLYGTFDLDIEGKPNTLWESLNLRRFRPPEMMQHAFFPEMYIAKVRVNRRIVGPLSLVYEEIGARWTMEARKEHGLNQFAKCYCFGDGSSPNLFWYGAAWRLSNKVNGETLEQVTKIFVRHGFTACGVHDKRRIRDFEFW